MGRRAVLGILAVATALSVAACSPAQPTAMPDAALPTVMWYEAEGYSCEREQPSSAESGVQWTCSSDQGGLPPHRITIDADSARVATISVLIEEPLGSIATSDWQTITRRILGGPPPFANATDALDALAEDQAEQGPLDIGGIRVTVSSTNDTTTVILAAD